MSGKNVIIAKIGERIETIEELNKNKVFDDKFYFEKYHYQLLLDVDISKVIKGLCINGNGTQSILIILNFCRRKKCASIQATIIYKRRKPESMAHIQTSIITTTQPIRRLFTFNA